ncbi:hypothetical protein [Pseudoduganella sp. UC29_71]|uniref:hypothetical protein n=1 Tax=Pseudoduganella sp. UC29_71 TaxID=3350174 RepID=UPI0036715DEF
MTADANNKRYIVVATDTLVPANTLHPATIPTLRRRIHKLKGSDVEVQAFRDSNTCYFGSSICPRR